MKKSILKLLMLFVTTGLFFISCDNDDSAVTGPVSAAEVTATVEADDVSDEVNNLLDGFFAVEEVASKTAARAIYPLTCMTKTVVINLETQVVTLDFGESCLLPSGNTVSGKIVLTYAVDISAQSLTINYTYDNFYFNDLKVTGTNKIVRIRSNMNEKPQSTLTIETKVTWPNGDFAVYTGTKVREFSEGFGTIDFKDNVFTITGNWKTTFSNGAVVSAEIIEPLRREMTCRFFVSGKVKFKKSERFGVLDFGTGDCDEFALFTLDNGEEFQIELNGKSVK
jgi:hypothetical protein